MVITSGSSSYIHSSAVGRVHGTFASPHTHIRTGEVLCKLLLDPLTLVKDLLANLLGVLWLGDSVGERQQEK